MSKINYSYKGRINIIDITISFLSQDKLNLIKYVCIIIPYYNVYLDTAYLI